MNHRELAEHERLVSSLRAHLERALERLEDAREQLAGARADHVRTLESITASAATLEERTRALASAGVSGQKADRVLEEVGALCVPNKHIE